MGQLVPSNVPGPRVHGARPRGPAGRAGCRVLPHLTGHREGADGEGGEGRNRVEERRGQGWQRHVASFVDAGDDGERGWAERVHGVRRVVRGGG